MRAAAAALALVAAPVRADAPPVSPVPAPSGYEVRLHEILDETQPYDGTRLLVVRLVAPAISDRVSAPNLQADMQWACETWGLAAAAARADAPDQIIVEFMEAPVARGVASPGTRRFFETYTMRDGTCIWSLF